MPESNEHDPIGGEDGGDEMLIFEGHPALLPSLGALLLSVISLGLALLLYWLKQQSCHYPITTERVVVDGRD